MVVPFCIWFWKWTTILSCCFYSRNNKGYCYHLLHRTVGREYSLSPSSHLFLLLLLSTSSSTLCYIATKKKKKKPDLVASVLSVLFLPPWLFIKSCFNIVCYKLGCLHRYHSIHWVHSCYNPWHTRSSCPTLSCDNLFKYLYF